MKALSYYGQSRWWWLILTVGVLLVLGGFAYWFWPAIGYAVASQIFGWLLILAGVVQLCVASGENRPSGWGWWIVGGVLNIFIGFTMARSVILSEAVFPYFMAFFFLYWGLESIISACGRRRRYWVLGLINGVLECIIGYFFLESGFKSVEFMTSFLVSIAFIYWGFTVALAGFEMKPVEDK